jgi:cytochrome c biogenesis protein CcdA
MLFAARPLGLILLGLALGMRHAIDPDHVIAVTAILTRERRFTRAVRIGLIWGLGHSATVLAIGMGIIVFKLKVPARMGLTLEFMVAVVLILLGCRAAKDTLAFIAKKLRIVAPQPSTMVVHFHQHTHQFGRRVLSHSHPHVHSSSTTHGLQIHDHLGLPTTPEAISQSSSARSFVVGLVHGMAGSSAIALLVTAAIPTVWLAVLYIVIFCAGVMIGMVLVTAAIGAPFALLVHRLAWAHRRLSLVAGWLSFGFGAFLGYQIGVMDRLFGAVPHWVPH